MLDPEKKLAPGY